MEWPTHRAIGAATVVTLSAAAGLPLSSLIVSVPIAVGTSVTPDRMEPRFNADHRTWTHWLSTTVLIALLPAIILVVLGMAITSPQGVAFMVGHDVPASVVDYVSRGAVLFGILVGVGRLCGCVMHTVADALNPSGSPLLGPWSKRDVHLLPKSLRFRFDSALARFMCPLSWAVAAGVVYLQVKSGATI